MLALPRTLARELAWAAGRRRARLRWTVRPRAWWRSSTLRRAWQRTDPRGQLRALQALQASLWGPDRPPPTPPPTPGTVAIYHGGLRLRPVRRGTTLGQGEHLLDIEDWLAHELGLDAMAGGEANIELTVRVLDHDAPPQP